MNRTRADIWQHLQTHARQSAALSLVERFARDPLRAQSMSYRAGALWLDISKQRLDVPTIDVLCELAERCDLGARIDAMFAGAPVNYTEQRAALHTALRRPAAASLRIEGVDIAAAVQGELSHMRGFAEMVRSEQWRGFTGESITDIVNIGIGGSDLGPHMVCEALSTSLPMGPAIHFVSNVDGAQIRRTLARLRPERTLFVVVSKTFTTTETLINARTARQWLLDAAQDAAALSKHFVAVSANTEEARAFGVGAENIFRFWDWVGGRYSLWSAAGLSIMLALGCETFDALLAGAYAMDEHFRSAPLKENLPVIAALTGVWNINFLGMGSLLIAPYNYGLQYFPAYLQQLEMESNGKSVASTGLPVDCHTAPVIWGQPAVNGQHAYFQMLHQGTAIVPVDFILALKQTDCLPEHHAKLVANCLAQSAALMRGRSAEEVRGELLAKGVPEALLHKTLPHRVFEGNRPSSTLILDALDAHCLGALIALYEHKTFVQSVIWDINAFDQWGVELGKRMTGKIEAALQGQEAALQRLDASTLQQISYCKDRA